MNVEVAIADRLKLDSAVAALVSSRVYQLKLPQKPTYPAIRVQLIDEPQTLHLRGVSSLYRARVQVDAFANEYDTLNSDPYATVTQLADAIDGALAGKAFDSDDSPVTARIREIHRDARMPFYEPGELRVVRIMQDYVVWWIKEGIETGSP